MRRYMGNQHRILLLFAHPAIQRSRVNRVLIRAVKDIEGVTFHDLYGAYPEFDIDVEYEQALLLSHDIFIIQHPLFWYSTPAIIKEYLDLVMEHDWAYGSKGDALQGKQVMHAVTTGGRETAYHSEGLNGRTVREFLIPFEHTAILCGMIFLPPFVVHGTHQMSESTINQHAEEYQRIIIDLREGRTDLEAIAEQSRINTL